MVEFENHLYGPIYSPMSVDQVRALFTLNESYQMYSNGTKVLELPVFGAVQLSLPGSIISPSALCLHETSHAMLCDRTRSLTDIEAKIHQSTMQLMGIVALDLARPVHRITMDRSIKKTHNHPSKILIETILNKLDRIEKYLPPSLLAELLNELSTGLKHDCELRSPISPQLLPSMVLLESMK